MIGFSKIMLMVKSLEELPGELKTYSEIIDRWGDHFSIVF